MPLNGEEKKAWHEWYTNPRGGDAHLTSIGSRARPVSIGAPPTDIDELVEQMIRRGVLARDEPKTTSQISSCAKRVSRKKR